MSKFIRHHHVILKKEYFASKEYKGDNRIRNAEDFGGKPFYITGVHERSGDPVVTYDIKRSNVEFYLVEEQFLELWNLTSMGKPNF